MTAIERLIANVQRERKFRFAISRPDERCSAVWSIFSHKDKDNVYSCSGPIGHSVKVSLHGEERDGERSLVCRVGHTQPYHDKHFGRETPRQDFARWKRRPTPERGVMQVVSVQIPLDHITGPMQDGQAK
jgi:hypothetical protein